MNGQTAWNYDSTFLCALINRIDDLEDPIQTVICPNPFSTSALIKVNYSLKEATLQIYNSLGQEIKRKQHLVGREIELERDNLAVGVYLLKLTQGNSIIMENKVIIAN